MAFFDELGAKLTKTGQMTVQKANDLAEVTKLNMRTGELNKAIQEHYAKLGERYYALHAAGPEEDLAAICGLIDKANEELESIRLELQRIRQLKAGMDIPSPKQAKTAGNVRISLTCLLPLLRQEQITESAKNAILKTFISHITFYRSANAIQIHYRI